jgi:hypothetical protein
MATPTALDTAYARLQAAMAGAASALEPLATAAGRAIELAYLREHAPPNAPLFAARFSGGPPEEPTRPILPDVAAFRSHANLAPLVDAIDDFMAELVFNAECSEWAEASINATHLLVGAELVATAARETLPVLAAQRE